MESLWGAGAVHNTQKLGPHFWSPPFLLHKRLVAFLDKLGSIVCCERTCWEITGLLHSRAEEMCVSALCFQESRKIQNKTQQMGISQRQTLGNVQTSFVPSSRAQNLATKLQRDFKKTMKCILASNTVPPDSNESCARESEGRIQPAVWGIDVI